MGVALQPIIFCGHGSNLYPLCDAAAAAAADAGPSTAKALLPVANRPLISFALQSVLTAGYRHAIVLAPAWQHAAIKDALGQIKLHSPASGVSARKKRGAVGEELLVAIVFSSHRHRKDIPGADGSSLSSATKPASSSSSMAASDALAGTSSEHAMHVDLLPLGPHDSSADSDEKAAAKMNQERSADFRKGRLGTAELLRWTAACGYLRDADPLILPVDLIGPAFAIRDLIDVYIQAQATCREPPSACCVLYERGAGQGLGKERDREGPSRLISAMSNDDGASTHRLVFLRDSDLTSDMEIRRSLLRASPRTRISTRLLDAHAYILNRAHVLPLIENNHRLTSLRDHVLPLIAKATWQPALREKAGWILTKTGNRNVEGSEDEDTQNNDASKANTDLQFEAIVRNARSTLQDRQRLPANVDEIRCLAHIVRLDHGRDPDVSRPFIVRANTLATYIESNRWVLQSLAQEKEKAEYCIPRPTHSEGGTEAAASKDAISSTAQIAPDAVVGRGASVGERASIRNSVVGEGCEIARGVKLNNCILLPGAKVGENSRLEGTILCGHAVVGAQCNLVDCDVGPGVSVDAQSSAKHEKIVGEHDEEETDDDDDEKLDEHDGETDEDESDA